jgi:SAM-dependent methyltransferase
MAMYDNDDIIQTSFDATFLSEYLIQAQWAEFVELKKIITEVADQKQAPISILDIGIGNARIPRHLCGIKEIWDRIAFYDGTDNAQACVELSRREIENLHIQNKVSAYFFDATNLGQWGKRYDLVIMTWFTAGNFYPKDFPFDSYQALDAKLDLGKNERFETIFKNAYGLLNPGGEIVIGSCYIENDGTRQKQEASYIKMGLTIITDNHDSFTATKEGFWSQRFTKEKLLSYLHFVDPAKISFTPLDTYEYAMQVRIRK